MGQLHSQLRNFEPLSWQAARTLGRGLQLACVVQELQDICTSISRHPEPDMCSWMLPAP